MGTGQPCVLCGNRVRSFHSHGGGAPVLEERQVVGGMLRENDRCPVCHGCDRTRMMKLFLEKHTNLGRERIKVLHVAPDFGLYLWLRRQANVDYTATDIDAERYRHIVGIRAADITRTTFSDNLFDIIICSHVLEHIPDDSAAFRELFRILKPGGVALLLTPYALDGVGTDEDPLINDASEQDRRFGQWDHVRIYDRDDFLERMRKAGFIASLYNPFDKDSDVAKNLHLNPLEQLPIGYKEGAS